MSAFQGLVIFKKDPFLRYSLIFTALSWVIIDLVIIFTDMVLSSYWISLVVLVLHLQLVLLLMAMSGVPDKWSRKRIILGLAVATPFYFVTMYLIFFLYLGTIILISEICINVLFAHWCCLGVGTTLQEKIGEKKGLGVILYLICGIIGFLCYFFLTRYINPPASLSNIWNVVFGIMIIFAYMFLAGIIVGGIRKQFPISLGPYYLMSFLYFLYLSLRFLMVSGGSPAEEITLISVPVSIFLLLYACGKVAYNFFVVREQTEPTRGVRSLLIYFMLIQVGVHIAVIINMNNSANMLVLDEMMAFASIVVYIGMMLAFGIYILIKYTRKQEK